MFLALLALAAIGHASLWIGLFNHLHARNIPCRLTRVLGPLIILSGAALPVLLAVAFFIWPSTLPAVPAGTSPAQFSATRMSTTINSGGGAWLRVGSTAYVWACAVWACVAVPRWLARRWNRATIGQHATRVLRIVSLADETQQPLMHGKRTALWAALPGNQIFDLEINEKEITLSDLHPDLDGLTIAHISDLHLSGKMSHEFYRCVVQQTAALTADLIAVTGDIVDRPKCLSWLPQIFPDLQAPGGVYFVLGNHDKSLEDVEAIRRPLIDGGWISLGGRWLATEFRDQPVLLAGNERPWLDAPPDQQQPNGRFALRLALLHTPDQWAWAADHDMTLALAGHNHGGQICLPVIGPVICPSRYGTRFVGGLYQRSKYTLHVSRGISGLHPVRFGCRPEISRLVLRCGDHDQRSSASD